MSMVLRRDSGDNVMIVSNLKKPHKTVNAVDRLDGGSIQCCAGSKTE